MNSSFAELKPPPGEASSAGAGGGDGGGQDSNGRGANRGRGQGRGRGGGKGSKQPPLPQSARVAGEQNQPDTTGHSNNPSFPGAPSRGAPGRGARGGYRGKNWQPSHAATAGGVPVVPRILMRPERAAAQTSDEAAVGPAPVVMLARRSVPAPSAPQPPPPPPLQVRPPARQQTSAESLVISGVTSYRHIVGQPRSSRLTILTPGGQLLDGVVRKHLSQLDCRSCIGVLGRPSAGKSMVLSRLASRGFVEESMELFPLATEENKIGTLGVDFWVTPARIILVDAPPMVSVASSEMRAKLLNDSRGSPRLSALRARDLQLATLLIRVSSVLLVFADRGDGVDEGLAKLLVDARELLNQFPGPKHHHSLSSRTYPHYGKQCKLHIVINTGAAPFGADAGKGIGENLGELARAYEEATEFIVCGVSVIPSRCTPPMRPANRLVQGSAPRFLQVAESWLATPTLPLYPPPLDISKSGAGEQCRRSLLCWPPHSSAGNHPACGTFEEAVDKLRAGLLAPPPMAGWDEKPVGEWMNTCLKVWDAIRRSHKLRDTASMF